MPTRSDSSSRAVAPTPTPTGGARGAADGLARRWRGAPEPHALVAAFPGFSAQQPIYHSTELLALGAAEAGDDVEADAGEVARLEALGRALALAVTADAWGEAENPADVLWDEKARQLAARRDQLAVARERREEALEEAGRRQEEVPLPGARPRAPWFLASVAGMVIGGALYPTADWMLPQDGVYGAARLVVPVSVALCTGLSLAWTTLRAATSAPSPRSVIGGTLASVAGALVLQGARCWAADGVEPQAWALGLFALELLGLVGVAKLALDHRQRTADWCVRRDRREPLDLALAGARARLDDVNRRLAAAQEAVDVHTRRVEERTNAHRAGKTLVPYVVQQLTHGYHARLKENYGRLVGAREAASDLPAVARLRVEEGR